MRELRNVVQRALLLRNGPLLDTDALTFEPPPRQGPGAPTRAPHKVPEGMTLQQWLEQVERECVEDALRTCDNQRGKAAKRLGLSRTSLFERMKALGLRHRGPGGAVGPRARESKPGRGSGEPQGSAGPGRTSRTVSDRAASSR